MTPPRPRPAANPFATRHTQPGRVVPLDDRGAPLDLAALASRLRALGGSGTIVGPHGAGKTNLLAHLAGELAASGVGIGPLRARGFRDTFAMVRRILTAPRGAVMCIDSWEQLSGLTRLVIGWLSRSRGCGLLVTSHGAGSLPTLIECRTSPALLAEIVARLPDAGHAITPADVAKAYDRHAGNLRDALADLYDRFEARRSP